MLGWKNIVLGRLKEIEVAIKELTQRLDADERLAAQNADLFDRLMSINWEKYAHLSPDMYTRQGVNEPKREIVLSPTQDEENIGEILSNEDLGQ